MVKSPLWAEQVTWFPASVCLSLKIHLYLFKREREREKREILHSLLQSSNVCNSPEVHLGPPSGWQGITELGPPSVHQQRAGWGAECPGLDMAFQSHWTMLAL